MDSFESKSNTKARNGVGRRVRYFDVSDDFQATPGVVGCGGGDVEVCDDTLPILLLAREGVRRADFRAFRRHGLAQVLGEVVAAKQALRHALLQDVSIVDGRDGARCRADFHHQARRAAVRERGKDGALVYEQRGGLEVLEHDLGEPLTDVASVECRLGQQQRMLG